MKNVCSIFPKILFILGTFLLTACVGTVEDTSVPVTKSLSNKPLEEVTYDGIQEALPIAFNKIDIFFPSTDLDPENATYMVNYDGLLAPIPYPAINVTKDYRGRNKITLRGLTINTSYNISVEAYDNTSKVMSSSGKTVQVSTLANITADFEGISAISNMPGQDGLNSVKVEWPAGVIQGTPFSPEEVDVYEYQVTVLNATALGPADFDNIAFGPPDRRVIPVDNERREVVVTGLTPGTKYLVQVRAIHFGYTQNSLDDTYLVEVNSNFLEIETLTNDLSLVEFDSSGVLVQNLQGVNGLYALDVSWPTAGGAFDHYRVFYSPKGNNVNTHSPNPNCQSEPGPVLCKKMSFDSNSTTITGLTPYTDYEVVVTVCQKSDCQKPDVIFSTTQEKTTTQAAAPFGGIIEIRPAKYADRLDELYLVVVPPQANLGVVDGVHVVYIDGGATEHILNSGNPADNNSTLSIVPFDYETAAEYGVKGIDVFSGSSYCFKTYVFTFDSLGNKVLHDESAVTQCTVPQIDGPTLADFGGLRDVGGCISQGGAFQVFWESPTAGIYSDYELIYRKKTIQAGGYSFGSATSLLDNFDDPDANKACNGAAGASSVACLGAGGTWEQHYFRDMVDPGEITYSVTGLPNGQDYEVGMLSFFQTFAQKYRSEFNTNIYDCTSN